MGFILAAVLLSAAPVSEPPRPAAPSEVVTRGKKLEGLPPLGLAELLAAPEAYASKAVAVEGKVRRACRKRGCWMELSTSEDGPGVRVTFKDYGFFVPLDSAGRLAKVEGTVEVSALSPAEARHLEAEGAHLTQGEGAVEVQLVATGVELRK